MRPGLLWADRVIDLAALPPAPADLIRDLELGRLFAAMADDDPVLLDIARRIIASGITAAEEIRYRQSVAADFLAVPGLAKALYDVACGALDAERRAWGGGHRDTELVLRRSLTVLATFLGCLRALRALAVEHRPAVTSDGVRAFFDRIATQCDDAYMGAAEDHVRLLGHRHLVVTAGLGEGNRGSGYVLRRTAGGRGTWRERAGLGSPRGMTIEIALRDQNAMNSLAELRAQALAPAAGVIREAVSDLLVFFRQLRTEAGFYLGCVNLQASLAAVGVTMCWPEPAAAGTRQFVARDLVDPCLALATGRPVVGNDIDASGAALVLVTGANGGGKSTLLRAVGVAQLLLQAGMPVAAAALRASVTANVLTHFTREDDAGADGGRLDAELTRLGDVVAQTLPTSLVLLNESVSGTNERDATEIAHGAITGLADAGATVWFVTHLFELASQLQARDIGQVLFLRAERGSGGERPYRISVAPPLPTSYGLDVYRRLRGDA